MQKSLINFVLKCLFLAFLLTGCSANPSLCEPVKAVELLINHPRIGPTKTETNFYQVVSEDEAYVYFGYYTINWRLQRVLDPFYKTPKEAFYTVKKNLINTDRSMARGLVKEWIKTRYPQLKEESIQVAQTMKIELVYNDAIQKYDFHSHGWIDFYIPKMEKSTIKGIDAAVVNYSIKKFNYSCVISENNRIVDMKIEELPVSKKEE